MSKELECPDCNEMFLKEDLFPWRYEPEIKICEACIETRDEEEEDDEYRSSLTCDECASDVDLCVCKNK